MNKKHKSILFLVWLSFFSSFMLGLVFSAEFRTESNKVITNVGNPVQAPPISASGAFSCPLKGPREIWCGSFMSDPKFNKNRCLGSEAIDRGHCSRTYGLGCWKGDISLTNNQRRAHSIDVNGPAGEPVYLPTIEGKIAEWKYGTTFGPLSEKDGGGYGHTFTSRVGNDNWIIYLIHVNNSLTAPSDGKIYKSGDQVTTIAPTGYTHVHINIGKNPASLDFGPGWLSPEDLGMCTP